MSILYVGSDKDYSTITSAINAASDDDIIAIDPGTYNENLYLSKAVSLRGNTDMPQSGEVVIHGSAGTTLKIGYAPTTYKDIYIEGIQLEHASQDWKQTIAIDVDATKLSLYINRCKLIVGSNMYNVSVWYHYLYRLYIENCYMERGHANILRAYWDTRINDSKIYRVHLNNSYYCYQCSGGPDILDWVSITTSGYGPAYGSYYTSLNVGYFDGYVYEQGNPVSRKIYLHNRDTGELIGSTTSSGNGYYYIETTYSGAHYIVCLDALAEPDFNDLIIGNVYPTTISGQ